MVNYFIGLLISILTILPALYMIGASVQVGPALDASLTHFEPIRLDNLTRLEWTVETSNGTKGAIFTRGLTGTDLIQSEPSTAAGIAPTNIASAFYQEDPASYPGPEGELGRNRGAAVIDTTNDLESGENLDLPRIIGNDQYPANNLSSNSNSQIQPSETIIPAGSLAGKIYLWVAFVAALVMFTAVVLGAILLYTRERNEE